MDPRALQTFLHKELCGETDEETDDILHRQASSDLSPYAKNMGKLNTLQQKSGADETL
jgi:hypothetical protein